MLALRTTKNGKADLVRSSTTAEVAGEGLTIGAWGNEQTATPDFMLARVSFNAAKTIGLAFGDGSVIYRATAAGAWAGTTVTTLFASPDGQRVRGIAWGTGGTCVAVCVNASGNVEILYSANGGTSWTESASDLSTLNGVGDSAIVLVESNGGGTFALVARDPATTSQFIGLVSTNGGAAWGSLFGGPAYATADDPSSLYYDSTSGRWVMSSFTNGTSYSDDLSTWSSFVTYTGAEAAKAIVGVARLGAFLYAVGYAGTDITDSVPVVLRSSDASSWTRLSPTGFGTALPFSVGVVGDSLVVGCARIAGAGNLLFKSANGTAWTDTGDSSLGMSPTAVMSVADGLGSRVYAAANDFFLAGTSFRVISAPFEVSEDGVVTTEGNFISDDGLMTAVTVSLFTDARATVEDGLRPGIDAGGCWQDTLEEGPGPKGSKLWLLKGGKTDAETLRKAQRWGLEAIEWFRQAKLASKVDFRAERDGDQVLLLTPLIWRPGESSPWQHTWRLHLAL